MGTKRRIVAGRSGTPLAGKIECFYLEPAAVAHVKVINSGKTVVLFLRGWQPPIHVHCAKVVTAAGKGHPAETELICEIIRILQSNRRMYLRVCGYPSGRIFQIVDYDPQFCGGGQRSFCVAVARGEPGKEMGQGEPLYRHKSVTIWQRI